MEKNPVLEICQLVIFPRVESLEIKRPEKFGGNAEFSSFAQLKDSFAAKELHPMDLKNAVAEQLVEILKKVKKAN